MVACSANSGAHTFVVNMTLECPLHQFCAPVGIGTVNMGFRASQGDDDDDDVGVQDGGLHVTFAVACAQ